MEAHWIATYVRDNVINYFDSFGLPPFRGVGQSCKKKKPYSFTPKSTNTKSLYNYLWLLCLYFLNEMNKGGDYFDLLQVFSSDTNKNEKFIENYFRRLEKLK